MYSRPSSRDFRVPSNYGGNAFRDNTPTQAQDLTRRQPQYRQEEPSPRYTTDEVRDEHSQEYVNDATDELSKLDAQHERCEGCPKNDKAKECAAPTRTQGAQNSLFSPLGALGSEEILLIALALIIFQSGKEPELALILLALLFIN